MGAFAATGLFDHRHASDSLSMVPSGSVSSGLCQNGKGGIEKVGIKIQSPSVRNDYGNQCCCLTPSSNTPPFRFGDSLFRPGACGFRRARGSANGGVRALDRNRHITYNVQRITES